MEFGIYWFFSQLQTELVPIEDRSELRINMSGPEGATFRYMDNVINSVASDLMTEIPDNERLAVISITSRVS